MKTPIPYTQTAFNKIASNSIQMHNNAYNTNIYNTNVYNATSHSACHTSEFVMSFINDLRAFIEQHIYDVNLSEMTSHYVTAQMRKYGKYVDKSMINNIKVLDMQFSGVFGRDNFLQDLFVPYLFTNTMIND